MELIKAPVISNSSVLSDPLAFLIWVRSPQLTKARPGQYAMVRCGEEYHMLLRRPLSIHRVSKRGEVAFLYAVVGRGTEWLAGRKEGDVLDLLGPLGNGFEVLPGSRSLLLVAGGLGVAPLAALADRMANERDVTLVLGGRTKGSIAPPELIPEGIKTVIATEDGSSGFKGMATDLLPQLISGADQVFACGPAAMYRTISQMSLQGIPVQVSLETVLGCGVGACLGCTIRTRLGPKQVCKDGPVFELADILWER